jgi:thioredoxin-like negative regulator of GroEL
MKKEILIMLVIVAAFALIQTLNFVGAPTISSSPHLVQTDDMNFVPNVMAAGDWALVNFWMPRCPACEKLKPAINQIAEEKLDRLRILSVNLNESPGIAGQFGVSATPTLVLLYRGREVSRKMGYMPVEVLDDWISTAIESS